MLAIVGGGLYRLWRGRRFARAAFNDAPLRAGRLNLADLCLALGGWMLGAAVAVQLLVRDMPEQPAPADLLRVTSAGALGASVVVIALLARVAVAFDQGLRGFGLGIGRIMRALGTTGAVTLFILPATFLTLAAVTLLLGAVGVESPAIAHDLLYAIRDGSPTVRAGLIAAAVLIAPLIEEIVFRGIIQSGLRQAGVVARPWHAIVATAALFALIHGNVAYQAWPGLFVLALGLGYVYERTGSLWSSILIHAIFNALNIAMVLAGVVSDG